MSEDRGLLASCDPDADPDASEREWYDDKKRPGVVRDLDQHHEPHAVGRHVAEEIERQRDRRRDHRRHEDDERHAEQQSVVLGESFPTHREGVGERIRQIRDGGVIVRLLSTTPSLLGFRRWTRHMILFGVGVVVQETFEGLPGLTAFGTDLVVSGEFSRGHHGVEERSLEEAFDLAGRSADPVAHEMPFVGESVPPVRVIGIGMDRCNEGSSAPFGPRTTRVSLSWYQPDGCLCAAVEAGV